MPMLEGKTVLVTGSSRGIGAAIARKLANEGATMAIHFAHGAKAAEEVCRGLPVGQHAVFQADLSKPDHADRLFHNVVESFGHLDILVNNAGIFQLHDPTSLALDEWQDAWQRTMAINLTSPARLSLLAARHMATQGAGRIINISSRGAFRGEPNAPAYGASKAGLNAFTQSLALAFAPQNVLFYLIAPGFVETAMARPHLQGRAGEAIMKQSPLGRVATVEEIAETARFLATTAPASMTAAIVDVNGASYLRS